jgi:hypothetical protein
MTKSSNFLSIPAKNTLPERVRVLTMDGEMAYWADCDECLRLVGQGFATPVGTKKFHDGAYRLERVKLLRLTAPLSIVLGDESLSSTLPITLSKLAGQRYYRRERLHSGGRYYEHCQPKGTTRESFMSVLSSVSH